MPGKSGSRPSNRANHALAQRDPNCALGDIGLGIRPDLSDPSLTDDHCLIGNRRCACAIDNQCLSERDSRGVLQNAARFFQRVAWKSVAETAAICYFASW